MNDRDSSPRNFLMYAHKTGKMETFPVFYDRSKPITLEEVRDLRRVYEAAVQSLNAFFTPTQISEWTRGTSEEFLAMIWGSYGFYRVYRDTKQVIGYALFPRPGYLKHFYIDPAYQRQGIGSSFLSCLEADRSNANDEGLIGLHANESAVPFYLKQGYGIKGKKDLHVGATVIPVTIMEKALDQGV